MTSQSWNTLVSVLVFALLLATAGSARAQWGFGGISVQPSVSSFGQGSGTAIVSGAAPFDYGSFGGVGYGGSGRVGAFPRLNSGLSTGPRRLTTTSFQSLSNVVTLVPAWSGSAHRVHRRYQARPNAPSAAPRH